MIHIWRPLWERGGKAKIGVIGRRGVGGYWVFWTSNLFFIKESWIWAMIRHHANNILLTRNLPFYFDVRRWSHPLMISLHCWWTKSNNRMRGQFEYDVTIFVLFLFWFCSFTCMVRLLFHSLFLFLKCANKTSWLQNEY